MVGESKKDMNNSKACDPTEKKKLDPLARLKRAREQYSPIGTAESKAIIELRRYVDDGFLDDTE